MSSDRIRTDPAALAREVQTIWETNAQFWDEAMGEGDGFQRYLVGPSSERLLEIQPGHLVLEVACGNGVMARRLAQLGAQMVATDFSATFIERAKQHTTEYAARIEYEVVDAADREQLLALGQTPQGPRRFDAALCNMALMDMVTIQPLFESLPRLLKPGGRFVFSIPHPSFNNSYCRRLAEEEDREGQLEVTYSIKVTNYIQPLVSRGLGIVGQPTPHYYFHRPLSDVLHFAFQNGFVMDGMEEPIFSPQEEASRPFSWANYSGIPPVMSIRLRAPSG